MTHTQIFSQLWDSYTTENPSVKKVYDLFIAEGEEVVNDHIAFRTFDDPKINIEVLSKPFLNSGYIEKGSYVFETKQLFAKHYEHSTQKDAPRVFISQLKSAYFSDYTRDVIRRLVKEIPKDIINSDKLIFSGNTWGTPSFKTYSKLKEESEYAAWVYVYGFRANHFTVSINALKKLNSIEKVNQFLKDNNFKLNSSGGEIKGTKEELLQQSSIMADHIEVEFKEGVMSIPGCYYEFAQRYKDAKGDLYSGFIAKSADKIFESTNFYKK